MTLKTAIFLWNNRKLICKIIICSAFILMLPILFILMLPTIIFGDLTMESDILNNNSQIMQNIDQSKDIIMEILKNRHDIVIEEINKDIEKKSYNENDKYVIEDNYKDLNVIDFSLIFSQYCSSKKDYKEVKPNDLKRQIEKYKDKIFTYEIEEKTSEKLDGEIITIYIYRVIFVGYDFFSDKIFELTKEEKEQSELYNSNLSLFLGNYNQDGNGSMSYEEMLIRYPFLREEGIFVSPLLGNDWRSHVTSEFGQRVDPITGKPGAGHSGMDIAFPKGTPINTAMSGTVKYVKYSTTGYGYHLLIEHTNGLSTLYGHCSEILVTKGQKVYAGEVIAKVGTTGRSTGNHLHFEILINGVRQDPRDFLEASKS